MRILILEDDEKYSGLIKQYVGDLATSIDIAYTWKEVDKYLADADILWADLIIKDGQHYDDVDSSLLRIAEVRKQNEELVILVVSGSMEYDVEHRALRAGADAYANKNDILQRNRAMALLFYAILNAQTRRKINCSELLGRIMNFVTHEVSPTAAVTI